MPAGELDALWHEWSIMEQLKRFHLLSNMSKLINRAAMGLHIQDSELAALYHAPPNLRHTGNRHLYACAKEVFEAPDALSWARAMTAHPPSACTIRQYFNDRCKEKSLGCVGYVPSPTYVPDPDNEFTLYIILIGIQAQVCEAREVDTLFTPSTQEQITTLLLAWYQSYVRFGSTHHTGESPFCLMILWHSIFVALFSNLHDLEIAFGSHGAKAAASHAEYATKWAITPGAKRAALHVIRVRHLLSRLSLSIVPPIHIPRITFQAAIVCWCYIRFKEMSPTTQTTSESEEWKEFSTVRLSVRELERELRRIRNGWGFDQPLAPFNDVLQRLGQWGLSKKLGDILNVAIHEETNMR